MESERPIFGKFQNPFNRRDLFNSLSGLAAIGLAMHPFNEALAQEVAPATAPENAAGNTPVSLLPLNKLIQIAFIVKNLETALSGFSSVLGVDNPQMVLPAAEQETKTQYRGKPTPAQAKMAFFPLGSITLELIEPVGKPSIWDDLLQERGEGLHHLGFQVDDINTMLAQFTKIGFETIQTGEFGTGRYAYVDTTPAIRTIVELLEYYPQ